MVFLLGETCRYVSWEDSTKSFGQTKPDASKRSGAGYGYKTVLSAVAMSGSIGLISIDKP